MKKIGLFVFVFVVALILAGCSSPTPKASNAMPLEALVATSEPTHEAVVPEFQSTNADELYQLYGEHFTAESLGYSKQQQGVLFLINNQKYLVKDKNLEFELVHMGNVFYTSSKITITPNFSSDEFNTEETNATGKGMIYISPVAHNDNELAHGICFVNNSGFTKEFSFDWNNIKPENFVDWSKMEGVQAHYYIFTTCDGAVLYNTETQQMAYVNEKIDYLLIKNEYGAVFSSGYYFGTDTQFIDNWGYPYIDVDMVGEKAIVLSAEPLDLTLYSSLIAKLKENWNTYPKSFLGQYYPELIDDLNDRTIYMGCQTLRLTYKVAGISESDVEKACGMKLSFEDKIGITLNTNFSHTYSDSEYFRWGSFGSNLTRWGTEFNPWRMGIGDSLIEGKKAITLKPGSTETVDPFTSITLTGQKCTTVLGEEGEMLILISTAVSTEPESIVQCLKPGNYLYLVPENEYYFKYGVWDSAAPILIYGLTE